MRKYFYSRLAWPVLVACTVYLSYYAMRSLATDTLINIAVIWYHFFVISIDIVSIFKRFLQILSISLKYVPKSRLCRYIHAAHSLALSSQTEIKLPFEYLVGGRVMIKLIGIVASRSRGDLQRHHLYTLRQNIYFLAFVKCYSINPSSHLAPRYHVILFQMYLWCTFD